MQTPTAELVQLYEAPTNTITLDSGITITLRRLKVRDLYRVESIMRMAEPAMLKLLNAGDQPGETLEVAIGAGAGAIVGVFMDGGDKQNELYGLLESVCTASSPYPITEWSYEDVLKVVVAFVLLNSNFFVLRLPPALRSRLVTLSAPSVGTAYTKDSSGQGGALQTSGISLSSSSLAS